MVTYKNNFRVLILAAFSLVFILFASCKRKVVSDPKPFSLLGSNWTELGNFESPNPLYTLFIDSVGNFFSSGKTTQTTIGGYNYTVDNVAKWNGVNWQQIGTGTNSLNANSSIKDICLDNIGNLYAAGGFTDSTFVSSYWCHPIGNAYVAKWNGVKWSNLGGKGSLPAQYIYSIVFNPINGYLYASVAKSYTPNFDYDVYVWNGNSWATLDNSSTKLNGTAIKLYVDKNGNLYACGNFTNSAGKYFVAKWSGTNWLELGTGGNELNANNIIESICTDVSGNIYAAGRFTNSNGKTFVAKWDGIKWNELGGTNASEINGEIVSICLDGAGNLYAGGWMNYEIDSFDQCYYVAKWNGNSWSVVGKNTLYASGGFNQIAVNSTGTIYAVGNFANANKKCYVGSYP